MSEENVELVRSFVDVYNRGEFDAALELCTLELEGYPDASVFPEIPVLQATVSPICGCDSTTRSSTIAS